MGESSVLSPPALAPCHSDSTKTTGYTYTLTVRLKIAMLPHRNIPGSDIDFMRVRNLVVDGDRADDRLDVWVCAKPIWGTRSAVDSR